jgi:hypothetical protein
MIPMINISMIFFLSHYIPEKIPRFHSHQNVHSNHIHGWSTADTACGLALVGPAGGLLVHSIQGRITQWPWLRYRSIGGTDSIYKAYFLGLCKGISPQNMARNMVLTYLHFRILKFPLTRLDWILARRDEGSQPHFRECDRSKFSMQSPQQKCSGN